MCSWCGGLAEPRRVEKVDTQCLPFVLPVGQQANRRISEPATQESLWLFFSSLELPVVWKAFGGMGHRPFPRSLTKICR
eukprot:scaffold3504_cov240-Pinguiococcus_pyrenoidosus.AAC.60